MRSKISSFISAATLAILAPVMVHAQELTYFENLIKFIEDTIKALFPIITGVLIVLFGYQLIRFLSSKDDIEDHEKFRKRMINALIALFLWFVLFGLITVVANALDIGVGESVTTDDITDVEF